jgi:hypothetical protein
MAQSTAPFDYVAPLDSWKTDGDLPDYITSTAGWLNEAEQPIDPRVRGLAMRIANNHGYDVSRMLRNVSGLLTVGVLLGNEFTKALFKVDEVNGLHFDFRHVEFSSFEAFSSLCHSVLKAASKMQMSDRDAIKWLLSVPWYRDSQNSSGGLFGTTLQMKKFRDVDSFVQHIVRSAVPGSEARTLSRVHTGYGVEHPGLVFQLPDVIVNTERMVRNSSALLS